MGLVIITADDLGLDVATTDAILDCFRAGRITGASAMVWMSDSQRAASLAEECEIPLGLHLNLTQPFTDPAVPPEVRERQARLAEHFGRQPLAYRACDPRLQSTIARCIEDQVREFTRLYGQPPRHLDGHRHVHTCLNVLLSRSFGVTTSTRSTFTFMPNEKGTLNRGLRRLLNEILWRRFASTRQFVSIRGLESRLDAASLASKLDQGRDTSLEVMTHPGLHDEYEFLMSKEWLRLIDGLPLGTFDDLTGARRKRPQSAVL